MGRVRSLDRVLTDKFGKSYKLTGKLLSQGCKTTFGHVQVYLGRDYRYSVHVLVAEAFIGPRPEGMDVRHLNGNPRDNRVTNLAYGTRSDNVRDCYRYGGKNGRGKLTADQVLEIRRLLRSGVGTADLAEKFGVCRRSIQSIRSGETFSYLK